jgi:hypothetical protein
VVTADGDVALDTKKQRVVSYDMTGGGDTVEYL